MRQTIPVILLLRGFANKSKISAFDCRKTSPGMNLGGIH